ncbi:hypothetical protein ABZ835_35100 [Streptomyces sp. NPDC047461]|uniref:hypothetical protein n=1 Tax=Streptomyces sp. NPDC047461 TaxID=3155619 RepID=UPI0033DB494A
MSAPPAEPPMGARAMRRRTPSNCEQECLRLLAKVPVGRVATVGQRHARHRLTRAPPP